MVIEGLCKQVGEPDKYVPVSVDSSGRIIQTQAEAALFMQIVSPSDGVVFLEKTVAIHCLTDVVLGEETVRKNAFGSFANLNVKAGSTLYGDFTNLRVLTGTVAVYSSQIDDLTPAASGGDSTYVLQVGNEYFRVHTYLSETGTLAVQRPIAGAQYLLVGGGGGGKAGGGGGGYVSQGTINLPIGNQTITVGRGGAGSPGGNTDGGAASTGGASSIGTLASANGGLGAYNTAGAAIREGGAGGSGGGASGSTGSIPGAGGTKGGNGAAGGRGAGGAGQGTSTTSSITGEAIAYGGGGSAGVQSGPNTAGGIAGGGLGGSNFADPRLHNGVDGLGGGGGGDGAGGFMGGRGGHGRAVVRYPITAAEFAAGQGMPTNSVAHIWLGFTSN